MRKQLCLFAILALSAGSAQGAPSASEERPKNAKAFTSFLEYHPRAVQFPEALQDVAQPLEQGFTESRAGNKDAAASRFAEALEAGERLAPKVNRGYEDQLWFLTGMAHEGLGQNNDALSDYERSLRLRPNNLLSMFRDGFVLKQLGRCPEAIPKFREVEWQVKTLAFEMRYLIGECQLAGNDSKEAMKSFQSAYEKNPGFVPVLRKMVETRQELLKSTADPQQRSFLHAQLTNDLNAIVKQNPNDREASLQLARLLLSSSDTLVEGSKTSRAEGLVKRFVESSGYKDDAAARLLVLAQVKRGALDQAQQTLTDALKVSPKSSELLEAKRQLEIERQVKSEAAVPAQES